MTTQINTPVLYATPWTPVRPAVELTRTRQAAPTRKRTGPPKPDPTQPDFGAHAYNAALDEAEFDRFQTRRRAALANGASRNTEANVRQWAKDYGTPGDPPESLRSDHTKPARSALPKQARPGYTNPRRSAISEGLRPGYRR